MKYLFFITLFFTTLVVSSCAQNKSEKKELISLPAKDFQSAIQKDAVQVLDVRTENEYLGGHIKNALQANWNDQKEFEQRTQYLDKQKTVYVYCQAGGRSAAAQAYLINKGYDVVNLEGGMSNWKINNLPVEGNANVQQMRVDDFDHVVASHELVLVDIGAKWCPPCVKMLPTIEAIKKEQGDKMYFLAVDGGVDLEVMKHLSFEALPTFIIYKNGIEVWRKTGVVEKEALMKQLQ
jgi:rhodanese-related sulfurtransferase/thiol-disulfide isomerase/thioredoxin